MPPLTVDRDRGLPSNQVHRLAFDRSGRLWLAGPSGLASYDGHHVRLFDRRHGLECAGVRAVSVGADGTVWVGTDLGLEALSTEGRPVHWRERPAWPYGLVARIVLHAGQLWLATARGLVVLCDSRADGVLRLVHAHDLGFVRDVAPLGDASVVAVSAELGLVAVDADGARRLRHPDLPEPQAIRLVVSAGAGRLLVGTTHGVLLTDLDGRTLARAPSVAGSNQVSALIFEGQACVAAYGRTLVSHAIAADGTMGAGAPTVFGSHINHLLGDALGNLWVATDSTGVERLSCLRHAIEPIELGHPGAVYSVKSQAEGALLHVGGDGFVVDATVDATRRLKTSGLVELPSTIWDSLPDSQGGRWLATHAGLFHRGVDGAIERVGGDDGRLAAPCRVLLERADGLWVGTLGGLVRWHAGAATEVTGNDGSSLGYVYTLRLDAEGRIWVGTLGRGLWRETSRGFEPFVVGPLSATGNTCVIQASPSRQQLLVLQDERVILIEGGQEPRQIASEHPVAGWSALWVDEQRLAIGSSDGLRLLDSASGEVMQRINALYGAGAWEFTNNRTLVRGCDGRLYCGLNAGLFAVDLAALAAFQAPPRVSLADVQWQGVEPAMRDGVVRVEPGKWSVDVRVYTAWMVDEAQVRLRFRLVGFESRWSELAVQAVVRYSSLPPGRYLLQAQAFASLSGFGEVVTVLTLEVSARTSWQGLLGGVAAWYDEKVGLALRNRLLLERHRRLEGEIAERTHALARANEELERRRAEMERTARTDSLTGWANRRDFDERFAAELNRMGRSQAPVGLLIVDVDHFKRYNDRYGHPAGDECLRQVTRAMHAQLRTYDVTARYGGEEFAIVLPGADAAMVETIGRRLCRAVQDQAIPHLDAATGVVTVSVGGLSSRAGTPAELLRLADAALYAAKSAGRNRFVAHL